MPLPNISHEHLVHFNCPLCQKWWSIGDAPERDHWYCPWCGVKLSNDPDDRVQKLVDRRIELEKELEQINNKKNLLFPGISVSWTDKPHEIISKILRKI